jgi:hypothetical protein
MAPSVISANELTEVFYTVGALTRGAVTNVSLDKEVDTIVSTLTFLTVTYSPDASPDLPERLVLKRPLATVSDATKISQSELDFYSRLAPQLPSPPIVPFYLATPDGSLILQDLRTSHTNQPWPLPPSDAECFRMIDNLALVHGHWWQDSELGVTLGSPHTTESLTAMVSGIAALLPGFCDAAGDGLATFNRELLERVFGSRLRPWLRLTNPHALTVIHGDAHSWNFLFPYQERGPVYLIDWQLWHVDVGARELAFLMAAQWDGQRRQATELPLLQNYHEKLLASGIDDYSWEDLWLDYRLGVVRNLTIPILFWKRGVQAKRWQNCLSCVLAAYDDLRCDEII